MNKPIKKEIVVIILLSIISITQNVMAKEVAFTQEDRDRLIRVEVKLEEIDKRFEQIDKRFEQVDKRFEQVDKRFDQMMNFMWMLTTIFVAITGVTIGFALWDRRTMIRPFEIKVKEIEEMIEEIDEGKMEKLLGALRHLAQTDIAIANVLKKFSIL